MKLRLNVPQIASNRLSVLSNMPLSKAMNIKTSLVDHCRPQTHTDSMYIGGTTIHVRFIKYTKPQVAMFALGLTVKHVSHQK